MIELEVGYTYLIILHYYNYMKAGLIEGLEVEIYMVGRILK